MQPNRLSMCTLLILGMCLLVQSPLFAQGSQAIDAENANTLRHEQVFSGGYIADIDVVGDLLVVGAPNGVSTYSVNEILNEAYAPPIQTVYDTGTSNVTLHPNGQMLAHSGIGIPGLDRLEIKPIDALFYDGPDAGAFISGDLGLIRDVVMASTGDIYMGSSNGQIYRIQGEAITETYSTHPGGVSAISLTPTEQPTTAGIDGVIRQGIGGAGLVLAQFTQPVLDISWSSTGVLAILLEDSSIILLHQGTQISTPISGRSMAWSPDGIHLAVGGDRGTLSIWDTSDPTAMVQIDTLIAESREMQSGLSNVLPINNISWTSAVLVATGHNGFLHVWDYPNNPTPKAFSPFPCCITSMSISQDAVIVTRSDSSLWKWDLQTEQMELLMTDFVQGKLSYAAISPSGEYLVANINISTHYIVQLYQRQSPEGQYVLVTATDIQSDFHGGITNTIFTARPSAVVTTSSGWIFELDLPSLAVLRVGDVHDFSSGGSINGAALSPMEAHLAVGDYRGNIFVTDFQAPEFNFQVVTMLSPRTLGGLAYSSNALFAGYDANAILVNSGDSSQLGLCFGHRIEQPTILTRVTVLPTSNLLVCVNHDLILWDITNNVEVGRYAGFSEVAAPQQIGIAQDGTQIFVATSYTLERYKLPSSPTPPSPIPISTSEASSTP